MLTSLQLWDGLKISSSEYKYTGGRTEPIIGSYDKFMNACHLYGVHTLCKEVRSLLWKKAFLKGPDLFHFIYVIIRKAIGSDDASQLLEDHFLDDCAKRFIDDVWFELFPELIKLKSALNNAVVAY